MTQEHERPPTNRLRVPPSARIESLDQFRGYTVLAMFVVNFVGYFAVVPAILKHHNTYCSYADTVMPQFFFAVGFAYRLTFLRRAARTDRASLYARFIKRSLGLILVGVILYGGSAAVDAFTSDDPPSVSAFLVRTVRTDLFQALVHIGVTVLWLLPVIGASARVRIVFAVASASLQVVLSHLFYYEWVMTTPGIDGGPLGFLTWSVPTLAGSFAYDIVVSRPWPSSARRMLLWGAALMAAGYALSCLGLVASPDAETGGGLGSVLVEPPFVPPSRPVSYWTMNQRAGSISYLTFGAGLSMVLYAAFVWISDRHRIRWGVFHTFGTNALAGYVLHIIVDQTLKPFVPRDAAPWLVLVSLGAFLAICYAGVRLLEARKIYLRI